VLERFGRLGRGDASGTGLGLPIVEEIARLHGAALSLHDGSGGTGLKVRIDFPLAG